MIKVYVVTSGCVYEGSSVDGVFATPDDGMSLVEERLAQWAKSREWQLARYGSDRDEPVQHESPYWWQWCGDFITITEWEVTP